jgi:hypothetical protein
MVDLTTFSFADVLVGLAHTHTGYPGLKGIDPVYALPTETVRCLGLVK